MKKVLGILGFVWVMCAGGLYAGEALPQLIGCGAAPAKADLRVAAIPEPGYPARDTFKKVDKQGLIAERIKDILAESNVNEPTSDIYLSLTRGGEVIIERNGAVLRSIKDPVLAQALSDVLTTKRDEVVDSWEEETEMLSADGVLQKVCRFLFEKVCRWVSCPYPGQDPLDYENCVQECRIRITPLGCKPAN